MDKLHFRPDDGAIHCIPSLQYHCFSQVTEVVLLHLHTLTQMLTDQTPLQTDQRPVFISGAPDVKSCICYLNMPQWETCSFIRVVM